MGVTYHMSDVQFQLVYDTLSFSLACMMSTTIYLWFRSTAVLDRMKSAVIISGLVTFIAAYHYMRIFNSWVEAYKYGPHSTEPKDAHDGKHGPTLTSGPPEATGVPFNDAYRYMDWLLTVPLLLIEILLVMKLDAATFSSKAWSLGSTSALMIVSGFYGELFVEGNLAPRWISWAISMCFFLNIVYELMVGLSAAVAQETGDVASKINNACLMTAVSWCTYPVVYLFPMFGITGSEAVVAIQVGYSMSDIISKCGVGLLIYQISAAKTAQAQQDCLLNKGEL